MKKSTTLANTCSKLSKQIYIYLYIYSFKNKKSIKFNNFTNFSCCGAGTAADTDQVTRMVSANVSLQAFKFPDEMVPVVFAARSLRQYLFKYMVIYVFIVFYLFIYYCDLLRDMFRLL